jgi:hypothetical protein
VTQAETLPPRRTLNNLFDGYCKVCWNPVYVMWVDKTDPAGECMFGHKAAHECPEAMGRAKLQATMERLRSEGVLPPKYQTEPATSKPTGRG